jgi:hypothetical protein
MLMWRELAFVALLGASVQASQSPDELRQTVRRLERQLDAPQLAARESAEKELTNLGPAILGLLSQPRDDMSPEVIQRLTRVRQAVQRKTAQVGVVGSTVTLDAQRMPLAEVLGSIEKQTGNRLVDMRAKRGQPAPDAPLTVSLQKAPFWKALDQVLDQAQLSLDPFGGKEALGIGNRSENHMPRVGSACYVGPLRIEPTAVSTKYDLRRAGPQVLTVNLEIAWEPRVRPISIQQPLADVTAVDDRGRALALLNPRAVLEATVSGTASAVEIGLPLVLPPRDTKQIAALKGRLRAVMPGPVETFRFDEPAKAVKVEKRIASTTVTLERARSNADLWEILVTVRFDQAANALESHRGWIFQNEAYLEAADGKKVAYVTLETMRQAENELGVKYLFDIPDKLDSYKFVYKTTSVIVPTTFEYEIKGIALP